MVTRPEGSADAVSARLCEMGFEPVLAPMLRIEARPVRHPGRAGAVLVTSANALPALAGVEAPLFAVGDATAARARAAGFREVESAGGDARDLLALVRLRCPAGASLLLAAGAGEGGALTAGLRAAGYRVRRRVAYAALPVPAFPPAGLAAIEGRRLRAVLFMSAKTARVFCRLLPPSLAGALSGVDAIAIGPAAAEVLAPLPWRQVRVSLGPTLEQMLARL